MSMKIERMLGIIHLLMEQDKVTAPALAEHFEVSRRTINRDIDAILLAGIPIITTQGFDGGIALDPHYKIDKKLFTLEELQAILSGLKGMDSISTKSYVKQLKEKFSLEESTYFNANDYVLLNLSSHYKEALTSKIEVLKKAIQQRFCVSFMYFNKHGKKQYTVEPHLLVFEWSSWYVFGYSQMHDDFRLFKLNRLSSLQKENIHFTYRSIPQEKLSFYENFPARYELQAIFDKMAVFRVIDEYGEDGITMYEDGSCMLKKDFTSYTYMKNWVSSFGSQAQVLEPVQLREDLCAEAVKIRNLYEKT